jgi:hypothetical protein
MVFKVKTIVIIAITLICGLMVYLFIYKTKNIIIIEVSENLNIELVKIQYGFYSGNSPNDKSLVEKGLKQTVFENGKSISFETICGENDFLITYDNEYYIKVRHFIPNNFTDGLPEPHEYHFNLKKTKEEIELLLEIKGQDGLKTTKKMSKISEAENNQQGQKIEKISH